MRIMLASLRPYTTILLSAFFFASMWCFMISDLGMEDHMGMPMSCPYGEHMILCAIDPHGRALIANRVVEEFSPYITIAFPILSVFFAIDWSQMWKDHHRVSLYGLTRFQRNTISRHALQEAFSRGTLQPKIFLS